MKVLYFAWLRTKTGIGEEDVSPPAEVATAGALVDWLASRSPGHADALANRKVVRVAVNQEHVGLDHPVRAGDEVALFPPVTGG
ncbi:molybdopterin synthase sulfur carrier subunit [Constrictibacter sp. MBR-5]|jgi:molybdopterin synthase sulfur carrier subunit|uniref:molybdopterin converting factor subunit 1 n=1 Tax=Constrictibacter sp. MBR-5 TaxID=3156467 RepID=UPI0033986F9C